MQYEVSVIKGSGRGKTIGFPTLNLVIPEEFPYQHGVYSGSVVIDGIVYKGAIHYGPLPAFNDTRASLEVHIIDETLKKEPKKIWLTLDSFIREVQPFSSAEDLSKQINKDIEKIKSL